MRRTVAVVLLALAVHAEPPPDYEYDLPVLDAEAVVEGEIPEAPREDERGDIAGQIKVLNVLAGSGVTVGETFDLHFTVPPFYSCVGSGPKDEERAAHRRNFVGLLKPGTRWVFTLQHLPLRAWTGWSASRTFALEGPGRADIDARLEKRKNIQEIAMLLIELPALEPYWHAEAKGRKPLVLLENVLIRRTLQLDKFGEKVQVWSSFDAARPEVGILNISAISIEGDTAKARLSYAIEGVAGEVELKREKGIWTVVKADLAEK